MLENRKNLYFINMKMLVRIITACLILLWITSQKALGQVNVYAPINVDNLIEQFTQTNLSMEKISGYRLQIIASDDRRKVDKIRSRVSQSHPEYRAIWKFSNPYYKVLIGAFRTKLEAERARYLVGQTYNNVLIVMDNEIPRTELAP
jgi:hypothetical protein